MSKVSIRARWKRELVAGKRFICALCGEPIISKRTLSVDHILPISLGGAMHLESNMQPAHAACNHARGNDLITESVQSQNKGYLKSPSDPKRKANT